MAPPTKESLPYGLIAGVFGVVAASAVFAASLAVGSSSSDAVSAEPPVADAASASPLEAGAPFAVTAPSLPEATSAPSSPGSPSSPISPAADGDAGPKPTVAKPEPSAEPPGPGFLTIITTLPARVSVRGRVLCTKTPCSNLRLAPGAHTITLENKDEGIEKKISVTITSGETLTKRVALR